MKTATTFFSTFFQTDCLLIDGVPHFSITGATQTFYGNTGGASFKRLTQQMSGVETPCAATDLSDFPGICPVLVSRSGRGSVEALAMTQETFVSLLKKYRGKKSKAGRYADDMTDRLVGVSVDLILKKEAGLLAGKDAEASVDETSRLFLRPVPSNEHALPINQMKQILIACGYRDGNNNMGKYVNEVFYNRLPDHIHRQLEDRYKKSHRGSTKFQHCTTQVTKRFEDILPVFKMLVEDCVETHGYLKLKAVVEKLDRFLPRYRHSKFPFPNVAN